MFYVVLSGGVDSMVTAVLVHKAIGNKLKCLFVDTGLMRMNEAKFIKKLFLKISISTLKLLIPQKNFYQNLMELRIPRKKEKLLENSLLMYLKNIQRNKKILNF